MSLDKKTVKELRKLAFEYSISGRSKMRKAELIKALEPFVRSSQDLKEEKTAKTTEKTPKKTDQTKKTVSPVPELSQEEVFLNEEEAIALPFSYDEDIIAILPKNPEELYAYWDLSTDTWERIANKNTLVLRLELESIGVIVEKRLPVTAREFYFSIPDSRGPYRVVLGRLENGEFSTIMASQPIKAPPNHPGPGEVRFAKIPFETSLPELHKQGGLMTPAPSEMPRGGFFTPDTDKTPYTRRFQ